MPTSIKTDRAIGGTNGVGSLPSVSGLSIGSIVQRGSTVTVRFNLSSVSVSIADNGSTASGGIKIFDFDEGALLPIGGAFSLTVATGSGLAGLASAAVVASLGTATAGADATLTSTEANFLQSTSVSLSSGAGTYTAVGPTTAPTVVDGTSTPADLFLNFAANTDPTTAGAFTVTGTITVVFSILFDQ